jgi:hypothetical protein
MDAIALSVAREFEAGGMDGTLLVRATLVALAVNTLFKLGVAGDLLEIGIIVGAATPDLLQRGDTVGSRSCSCWYSGMEIAESMTTTSTP